MAHVTNSTGMASRMMGMSTEMMKMSPDMMKGMMGSGVGKESARGAMNIVVVTAGPRAGQSILGRLIRHPVVLIGIGVAAGFFVYKYRKEIISDKDE